MKSPKFDVSMGSFVRSGGGVERPRSRGLALVSLLVLPALVAVPGCYERVVDARGIGTDSINVQKSYRSDTALDRAFFPDKPVKDNGFDSSNNSSNFDRSYTTPATPSTPR